MIRAIDEYRNRFTEQNLRHFNRAGIGTSSTHQMETRTINADSGGEATDVLGDNTLRPVNELLEPRSFSDLEQAEAAACEVYAVEGATSVTDASTARG